MRCQAQRSVILWHGVLGAMTRTMLYVWRISFCGGVQAQEKREYNISGFVPDGIEKVYLSKTEGLGNRVFLNLL